MYKKIMTLVCVCVLLFSNVYCIDNQITKDMSKELQLNEIIDELELYTEGLELDSMSSELLSGQGIQYEQVGKTLISALKGGITSNIKNALFVLIFLVLIAVVKSLELEKDSSISTAANIVAVLVIISVFITTYSDVITLMKKAIDLEIGIVQVVSPFMMGILILTGAITTSGLLEPIILLLVSTMGFCVNYVIIPLITISVVFNIITNMSDAVNLGKFSKFSNKMALWMNGIFLAIFLAVAGIQTTVSTSVDNITIKTTQAAVSGTIPVVR